MNTVPEQLSAPATANKPRHQPRIILVDDTPTVIEIYTKFLNRNGWTEVTESFNGNAALLTLQECGDGKVPVFDIVICDDDLKTRGVSGIDVLRLAKQTCPKASLFMIATDPSSAVRDELEKMQIPFITKPVAMGVFLSIIEESVKKIEPGS